jgi:pimeloyl-ACP methyl ester carboxylesterase
MANEKAANSTPTNADGAKPAEAEPSGGPSWAERRGADLRHAGHRLATMIGSLTLRLSNYPGRQWLGTVHRINSRREGGRSFRVTTRDHVRLHAWHFPAAADAPAAAQRLPIVMLHGWIEVKEFHFRRARQLSQQGHTVVLFDHRGHGRSDTAPASFGLREREDLSAVIDAAQARGFIGQRVITMGFSMGAATCLQHAANDERVAGVVAFAPFVDLAKAINSFRSRLASKVPERWLLAGFERATAQVGYQVADVSTLQCVAQLDKPVLLIEAAKDRNLPPIDHVEPLAKAKQRGLLERFVVDEANHMTLCRADWPGLDEAVMRFCAERA